MCIVTYIQETPVEQVSAGLCRGVGHMIGPIKLPSQPPLKPHPCQEMKTKMTQLGSQANDIINI